MPPRGLFVGALLLLAMVGALMHFAFGYSNSDRPGHAWGADDAYISYRYAENLVNGHGLVFNPGEKVEGYTNLLYTLLAAVFVRIDPEFAYIGCVAFNLLCYLATLLLFYWYLRRHTRAHHGWVGLLALSVCPLMWAWPASGLETSAVLLLQFALFVVAAEIAPKPTAPLVWLFCCLAGVSILLRADGFVFPILCSSAFLLNRKYKCFVWVAAFIMIASTIYVGARYAYYGVPLPNSFYAKVSGPLVGRLMSAAHELARLAIKDAFLLYLAPLALGWNELIQRVRRQSTGALDAMPLIPVIGLGLLAYWGWIGGDIFSERFLIVLIPLSLVHLMMQDGWLGRGSRMVGVVLAAVVLQFTPFVFDGRFAYHSPKYDLWIDLGKYLRRAHPNATLAIDAAGKVPYYSRLATIDMYGLNDGPIGRKKVTSLDFIVGHNKIDPDYVLARKPDLIAAWSTKELDLYCGLSRTKYRSQGYVLKYVVNASLASKTANIIDVTGMPDEAVKRLVADDYRYILIQRESARADSSRGISMNSSRVDPHSWHNVGNSRGRSLREGIGLTAAEVPPS